MLTTFYNFALGACLALTIIATLITWHACRKRQEEALQVEVLRRIVYHQTQRIDSLVADAFDAMQSREDTHAAIMAMPVLGVTEALVRVTREISLN
jgi:hypothetical protein